MNEKKTAEEMLKEYADNSYINSGSLGGSFNGLDRIPFVVWPSVVKIMQAYAAQETAALREENERLKDFVKEVDASLYHGPDLEDKEIMEHYIEVFKLIKEEARKILQAAEQ